MLVIKAIIYLRAGMIGHLENLVPTLYPNRRAKSPIWGWKLRRYYIRSFTFSAKSL
jgi:hypothetical protein